MSLIGIVDQGSQVVRTATSGRSSACSAAISLILALFNLLPLLPFDGGHAVIVVYEGSRPRSSTATVRVDFRKLMPQRHRPRA